MQNLAGWSRLPIPYGSAAPAHTVYFDVRAQDDKGQVAEKSMFLVPLRVDVNAAVCIEPGLGRKSLIM